MSDEFAIDLESGRDFARASGMAEGTAWIEVRKVTGALLSVHADTATVGKIGDLIADWESRSGAVSAICDLLEGIPNPRVHSFNGERQGINLRFSDSGEYNLFSAPVTDADWTELSHEEQSALLEHYPELVVQMNFVPQDVMDSARARIFIDSEIDTVLFEHVVYAEVDVSYKVFTVSAEIEAAISFRYDGSVSVTVDAAGSAGVALKAKWGHIGIEGERSAHVELRFRTLAEAEAYVAELQALAVDDRDVTGVIDRIYNPGSRITVESAVIKDGVNVSAGLKVNEHNGEITAGVAAGFDLATGEFIAGGTLQLEADLGIVRGEVEGGFEYRFTMDSTTPVLTEATFHLNAEAVADIADRLDLVVDGGAVTVEGHLDLTVWENQELFARFLNGEASLEEIYTASEVQINVLAIREHARLEGELSVEASGVTVAGGEFEGGSQTHASVAVVYKHPDSTDHILVTDLPPAARYFSAPTITSQTIGAGAGNE